MILNLHLNLPNWELFLSLTILKPRDFFPFLTAHFQTSDHQDFMSFSWPVVTEDCCNFASLLSAAFWAFSCNDYASLYSVVWVQCLYFPTKPKLKASLSVTDCISFLLENGWCMSRKADSCIITGCFLLTRSEKVYFVFFCSRISNNADLHHSTTC